MVDAFSMRAKKETTNVALISFPTPLWIEELKQSYLISLKVNEIYSQLQQGGEGSKYYSLQ